MNEEIRMEILRIIDNIDENIIKLSNGKLFEEKDAYFNNIIIKKENHFILTIAYCYNETIGSKNFYIKKPAGKIAVLLYYKKYFQDIFVTPLDD